MSTLSPIEKEYFEELFGMETGYILEKCGVISTMPLIDTLFVEIDFGEIASLNNNLI